MGKRGCLWVLRTLTCVDFCSYKHMASTISNATSASFRSRAQTKILILCRSSLGGNSPTQLGGDKSNFCNRSIPARFFKLAMFWSNSGRLALQDRGISVNKIQTSLHSRSCYWSLRHPAYSKACFSHSRRITGSSRNFLFLLKLEDWGEKTQQLKHSCNSPTNAGMYGAATFVNWTWAQYLSWKEEVQIPSPGEGGGECTTQLDGE
jgi:hypothetical protein